MKYQPAPIDISGIDLDESLQELSETLAENAHEIWADLRVQDGWVFGAKRDDVEKRHPCLVPFSELPESEKKYDREMVVQMLKGIAALGYRIVPPDRPLSDAAPDYLRDIARRLEAPEPLSLRELRQIWERHVAAEWKQVPKIYKMLGERILKVGEPLMAYDVLGQGMACFPEKADPALLNPEDRALWVRMLQLTGLALAQSGAIHSAGEVLRGLERKGFRDGETLGLLGRTHKEMGFAASSAEESRTHLAIAQAHYREAFENARESGDRTGAFYTGINAATLALACGKPEESRKLARTVQDICHAVLNENPDRDDRDYWVLATLGEAALLLEEMEFSEEFYRRAIEMAKGNFREISSMRKQAALVLRLLGREAEPIRAWFPVPRVWLLLGDGMDGGDAGTTFSKWLGEMGGEGIAFAPLARPGDLATAEAVLRRNLELNVVLPVSREEILQLWESEKRASENLESRLHTVLKDAAKVFELSSHCVHGNECNIQFAIHFLRGMARLRAVWLDTEVSVFPSRGTPMPPETISLPTDWAGSRSPNPPHSPDECIPFSTLDVLAGDDSTEAGPDSSRKVYSMMFADVKNYSKMDENQYLWFARHFLPRILEAITPFDDRIVSKRTTGDGLFLVFRTVESALNCAREFQQTISRIQWSDFHLPGNLEVRIALDAGPVYIYHDPIESKAEFCGKYVIRAARLEPVTPPGEIYATESFAALAAAEARITSTFEYAGQIRLPKNYGTIPVYHVTKNG